MPRVREQKSCAKTGKPLINLCANNYLGLSGDEPTAQSRQRSGRTIWLWPVFSAIYLWYPNSAQGTRNCAIKFFRNRRHHLYAAAFEANGGIFEPLFEAEDAIISDALNHASIIDGIRLCKAARFRYQHNDMANLEEQLQAAGDKRYRVIVTMECFPMDGTIAQLDKICDLADRYGALVMIDECHASGFMGKPDAVPMNITT